MIGRDSRSPFSLLGFFVGITIGSCERVLHIISVFFPWGAQLWFVALFAIFAGLSWRVRSVRLVLAAYAFVGIAAIGLVACTPLSQKWAARIARADPLQDADAIFVLGSSMQPDEEFSTDAMSRLLRGIELAAQKRAPRLIVSEVRPVHVSYQRAAQRELDKLGVKTELLSVGLVVNTHDEAMDFGKMARDHGWHRVIVVTSPTHCRRAAMTFEHEGVQVIAQPSMETRYDLPRLGAVDERVGILGSLLHETIGTWVYRKRGWIN